MRSSFLSCLDTRQIATVASRPFSLMSILFIIHCCTVNICSKYLIKNDYLIFCYFDDKKDAKCWDDHHVVVTNDIICCNNVMIISTFIVLFIIKATLWSNLCCPGRARKVARVWRSPHQETDPPTDRRCIVPPPGRGPLIPRPGSTSFSAAVICTWQHCILEFSQFRECGLVDSRQRELSNTIVSFRR